MNLAVVNEAVTEMNGVEHQFTAVSYTHLDVYKRQEEAVSDAKEE